MWIALMIVVAAVLLLVGERILRPDHSKSAQLMRTYQHLTKEQLESLEDDKLVTAVVSNLLAKADTAKKDPYLIIPKLSTERCVVYSVWLFDKQLATDTPEALRQSGQFGFSELAADGLAFLEQPALAELLRDYLQTADDSLVDAMRDAVKAQPLERLLIELIRSDISAFSDE